VLVSTVQRCAAVLHPGFELDVAAQVESVGDVLEVGEHGGLVGLGLGPVPLFHELIREGVAVEGAARAIDPCTRVAVVPPGATDVAGTVVHAHRKAHLAQVVQGVHAADARSDDHHVVVLDRSALSGRLIPVGHSSLLRMGRIGIRAVSQWSAAVRPYGRKAPSPRSRCGPKILRPLVNERRTRRRRTMETPEPQSPARAGPREVASRRPSASRRSRPAKDSASRRSPRSTTRRPTTARRRRRTRAAFQGCG
jgi:hypothetical protein